MRNKLKISIALLSLLLVCLSALCVYLHFQPHFPADTVIFHTDVSRNMMWGATSRIQKALDAYTLTIHHGDEQVTFSSQDLSLCLDEAALEKLAVEMQMGNTDTTAFPVFTMDITPVQQWLDARIQEDRIEPVGAHLVWNPETCLFELAGSVVGEYNDTDTPRQMVIDTILQLNPTVTLTEADYHVEYTIPEQIAAEQAALEQANAQIPQDLAYKYYQRTGEYLSVAVSPATIGSWLVIGEDGLSVTWDQESILAYAQSMAETYNLQGEDYFLAHDGRKINLTVKNPTNLIDAQALGEDILTTLSKQESGEREVPYTEQTKVWNYDGTYIEISIGEQKLYGFVNGELVVDTVIVTGCQHCNHGTRTGVFKVLNHGTNINLQDDPKYYVRYWMAFSLPQGLHDADGWRTEYGGEIYKTDGSGGCVNIPREIMKQVYETFKDGTPVIIYDDSFVISEEPVTEETA